MDVNALIAIGARKAIENWILVNIDKNGDGITTEEFEDADQNGDGEIRGSELRIDPEFERYFYVRLFEPEFVGVKINYEDEQTTVFSIMAIPAAPEIRVGMDFRGVDLEDAKLEGKNLFGAKFDKISNLKGTIFKEANLSQAEFYDVDISGLNFKGADLTSAAFVNVILDLTKLHISHSNIIFDGSPFAFLFSDYILEGRTPLDDAKTTLGAYLYFTFKTTIDGDRADEGSCSALSSYPANRPFKSIMKCLNFNRLAPPGVER